MKKKMQEPEMEFIKFDAADVIMTSGGMDAKGQESTTGYSGVTYLGGGGFGQPLQ